ncbi:PilZ domain-containing protein [Fibrobacter succinogenes]|uniref:PilZ domain-containing protein n=1 Tax=Fibrobacter succinogenes TaxID=833 RepID=A0A380RWX5_FIBSU|nr:PilZ domain-containing protein [Fibrobacter succinogenes]PWJ37564.1 PilZ domain-containing protein [Fibrobacter succinogenes subsp. elongatus]SUQ19811.1 PilZ domain-containing protein [Fibrobacter succinogenes]
MESSLQEAWNIFQYYILPVLPFVALVLIEVQLMYNRRENEVMFGTDAFNEKIKAFEFTPKEVRTLEKLVRSSKFENKDAVLNSSGLFEAAVSEFYRIRNVFSVRDETLEAIAGLRRKMDFTGSNPLAMVSSTRQFNVGDSVDLEFESGQVFRRVKIVERSEKTWSVKIDGSVALAKSLQGSRVLIRWTRMNDAVYSKRLTVFAATPDNVIFTHSDQLDKEQLRKWVREVVDFPVTATFPNGEVHSGVLYDLSAGGILLGLAEDVKPDQEISISFELPTFGVQNVDVKILNNLGRRNPNFPLFNSISAVFTGSYAWTQERVLQYIFEVTRKTKSKKNEVNGVTT